MEATWVGWFNRISLEILGKITKLVLHEIHELRDITPRNAILHFMGREANGFYYQPLAYTFADDLTIEQK